MSTSSKATPGRSKRSTRSPLLAKTSIGGDHTLVAPLPRLPLNKSPTISLKSRSTSLCASEKPLNGLSVMALAPPFGLHLPRYLPVSRFRCPLGEPAGWPRGHGCFLLSTYRFLLIGV